MKTLSNVADREEILRRLWHLTAQDVAIWGVMSVHQMVCHLGDSFRLVLAQKTAAAVPGSMPPSVLKWLALSAPFTWPKGVPTLAEVEQGKGGTKPVEFGPDHAALLRDVECFCRGLPSPCVRHPMFGEMSEADWMRWGYLHSDHHLRQFGR